MQNALDSRLFQKGSTPVKDTLRKVILVEYAREVHAGKGFENNAKVPSVRQGRNKSRPEVFFVVVGSVFPQQEGTSLVTQVARRLTVGIHDQRPFLSDVDRFLDRSRQSLQRALQQLLRQFGTFIPEAGTWRATSGHNNGLNASLCGGQVVAYMRSYTTTIVRYSGRQSK